jgi:hypothetical protein
MEIIMGFFELFCPVLAALLLRDVIQVGIMFYLNWKDAKRVREIEEKIQNMIKTGQIPADLPPGILPVDFNPYSNAALSTISGTNGAGNNGQVHGNYL